MWYLLNPKIWILAAGLAVLAASHFTAYKVGRGSVMAAWNKEKAELTAKALEAEKAARAKEKQLLSQRQQVEAKYAEEKRKAAAAASGAQSELDRLRDALAATNTCPAPSDPSAAGRAAGASRLESDLLGRCAQALTDLAAEADGLEARLVGLQTYVKDVCLKR